MGRSRFHPTPLPVPSRRSATLLGGEGVSGLFGRLSRPTRREPRRKHQGRPLPALLHLLLAGLIAGPAEAQTVVSGFVSKHFRPGYRETNPGVGYRFDQGPYTDWVLGTYRNSIDRQSFYAARELAFGVVPYVKVGALVGAATGYKAPLLPAVLGELILYADRHELVLLVQPLQTGEVTGFVALQYRYRFRRTP